MTYKSFRFIFKDVSQSKAELIGKKCLIYAYKIGSPNKLWTKDLIIDASFWTGKSIEVAIDSKHGLAFDIAGKSMAIIMADSLINLAAGSIVNI